jgi:biopolymer transport protein ExbB
MFDGGPCMVPLLACSIVTLAVLVDRIWAFYRNSKYDTRSLRAKVLDLMGEGRVEDSALLCSSTPGPLSAVVLTGLQSYAKHKDLADRPEALTTAMEKAMDDYSLHAMSAVEKRLAVLAAVGSAAPLIGFLGTVTGMIRSFAEMAGANDARVVAAGISEALITTAAGLIIALVAVIPYNVFLGMANRIDLEIEEAKSEILDFIALRARAR